MISGGNMVIDVAADRQLYAKVICQQACSRSLLVKQCEVMPIIFLTNEMW